MTFKECSDWLKALSDCSRASRTARLRNWLTRLCRGRAVGRWEIGMMSGENVSGIAVRYFGEYSDFSAFKREAHALGVGLKTAGSPPPPPSFPWLSLHWGFKTDEVKAVCLYSSAGPFKLRPGQAVGWSWPRDTVLFKPRPIARDMIRHKEMSAVLADVSALFSVADIVTQWRILAGCRPEAQERWSLRFREGVPWRRFICSQLAQPFAPEASRLAYLLLDRRVNELCFERGTLCAYFGA